MPILNMYNKFPSARTQISNFAGAVNRVASQIVAGNKVYVPDEVLVERRAYCEGCENREGNRCRLCGCWLQNLVAGKLKIATERCPANPPKWNAWVSTPESLPGDSVSPRG